MCVFFCRPFSPWGEGGVRNMFTTFWINFIEGGVGLIILNITLGGHMKLVNHNLIKVQTSLKQSKVHPSLCRSFKK